MPSSLLLFGPFLLLSTLLLVLVLTTVLTILALAAPATVLFCPGLTLDLLLYLLAGWRTVLLSSVGFIYRTVSMDAQANGLFKVLQTTEVDPASKIDLTNKLKTFIKHRSVPASAVANSFECIRICLSDSELSEAGFSTLSHLSKRLTLQNQQDLLAQEGIKTFDILLERLGDSQERDRQRAIQAFIDFWSTSPQDVETFIRDKALTTKNTRAKRASMQWIVQVSCLSTSGSIGTDECRYTSSSHYTSVPLFLISSISWMTTTTVSGTMQGLP